MSTTCLEDTWMISEVLRSLADAPRKFMIGTDS
jgi:hypothetical protein